jgi:hypothetical protein
MKHTTFYVYQWSVATLNSAEEANNSKLPTSVYTEVIKGKHHNLAGNCGRCPQHAPLPGKQQALGTSNSSVSQDLQHLLLQV